ncbi:MAG: hypothetical protein A3B89_03575 [Candidatus Buchananbacteria bacterium RIFCSPHIGHO2_02_FULL_40_13]|uniref:UPF0235 protein A3A02_02580 n=1 Tax=Candidatus Buchananbacteria bacterium RIFCSPLOWO2_01_FULL_39_33 TaxID=1797543 RepID=A0A1G1YK25_9BACT|nr:MAG: hypothetical protein A2820_00085 [Candidatus Buchananbacteria bacterium RIFCSPHIGHO2_01_FULL_40_35]OGY50045.1 MAG: hypothetical protein A3B89_03575 [Candidatus Buchananbacteria bacterium RIFCSPHIGHO2_02_FULL_40_13]OGY52702.1 MAG: hypothetical protein A3A02_02580 [Candidatus Buchananbacteria bacterium RIFCSPLOWO2_01_FULL_39_33]
MTAKRIIIEVKPNAKEIKVEKITDNIYKIKLTASPIGGQANRQLIEVLAQYWGVAKSQVEIKSGRNSKSKVLIIYG